MNCKSLTLLLFCAAVVSATPGRSPVPEEIAELLQIGIQDLALINIYNVVEEDHVGHGIPANSPLTLQDDEDDDDLDENFSGPTYIDSIDKLEEIGINASAIDTDILEDTFLTAPQLIVKYGYEMEIHHVETNDGYILELHRMPGPYSPHRKQPVFLMHGILDSSSSWVLMGPHQGLAYLLVNLGYDVWMGNARGNRYSRKHVTLDPDGRRSQRRKFWQFSWHEIGLVDVPTMLDYVLARTQHQKLHYIGHSQGTTAFWVMMSERPEYNNRILSMQALAPVAFLKNNRSPFVKASTLLLNTIDAATGVMGMYEFLPTTDFLALGGQLLCREEAITQVLCTNVLFLLAGYNSEQLNDTMLPVILGHLPAGASTNQLVHYGQLHRSGKFRQYDWGMVSNLVTYGSLKPTGYNLANVKAPVALHYSANDWMAPPKDVETLHQKLPNVIGKFLVPDPKFNHLDFMYAIDVKTLLYDRMFNLMRLVEEGHL